MYGPHQARLGLEAVTAVLHLEAEDWEGVDTMVSLYLTFGPDPVAEEAF